MYEYIAIYSSMKENINLHTECQIAWVEKFKKNILF